MGLRQAPHPGNGWILFQKQQKTPDSLHTLFESTDSIISVLSFNPSERVSICTGESNRTNYGIFIATSVKGGRVVIMERQDYFREMEE